METALEFLKLEKIELGGIKGKLLSQQVVKLFEEFNEVYGTFTTRSYDPLDPGNPVSTDNVYYMYMLLLSFYSLFVLLANLLIFIQKILWNYFQFVKALRMRNNII